MTSPEANRTGAERKAIIEAAIQALEQGEVMLTPREAARAIGCGERRLRDGVNHRGFPHHRFVNYCGSASRTAAKSGRYIARGPGRRHWPRPAAAKPLHVSPPAAARLHAA